jgi:polar amino acid transport system substrate-binding protein
MFISLLVVLAAGCTINNMDKGKLTVKEGVLRVGMDLQYPPFETFDKDNNPSGISVDVAKAFADSLGLKLEVVNMDFSTIIPALETRDIDIAIASMSITKAREKKVDFSNPYFYFKIIGLMNKYYAEKHKLGEASIAEDLWKIGDTRFVGLAGQISSSIPVAHGFTVQNVIDKASAITEVSQGRADVLIISPEVVVSANKAYPDTTQIFWSPLDISPIGMAVTEGNEKLLDKANDFISKMDDVGGVYDVLRKKYQPAMDELYGDGVSLNLYIYE